MPVAFSPQRSRQAPDHFDPRPPTQSRRPILRQAQDKQGPKPLRPLDKLGAPSGSAHRIMAPLYNVALSHPACLRNPAASATRPLSGSASPRSVPRLTPFARDPSGFYITGRYVNLGPHELAASKIFHERPSAPKGGSPPPLLHGGQVQETSPSKIKAFWPILPPNPGVGRKGVVNAPQMGRIGAQ